MSAIPKLTGMHDAEPGTSHTAELQPLAVDAKTLAAMLGMSVRTVRTMDAAGKLPKPVKLNAHAVRWVLDGPNGVRAWLQAGAPDRVEWKAIHEDRMRKR